VYKTWTLFTVSAKVLSNDATIQSISYQLKLYLKLQFNCSGFTACPIEQLIIQGLHFLLRQIAVERSALVLCRFFCCIWTIHLAFLNTKWDHLDCLDFCRRLQLDWVRVAILMYLIFWH